MIPTIVSPAIVQIAASDPLFIAECNAWTDAHNPPMSDAELDAIEARVALADALADAELSIEAQAMEVVL